MFLSNRFASVLIVVILCASAPGCSWLAGGNNPASASTVIEPPKSEIPFATKEPETFQADLVTAAGGSESRLHYARKGTDWRVDTFSGDDPRRTIISTDKQVQIDHRSKTYAESPSGGGPAQRPAFVTDLTETLLYQKEHAKFEKLNTEGTLERYRVTVEGTSTPFIVTYDSSAKMVIRQEPENPSPGNFVFSVRGLNLEVSDDVFTIPKGYRKVTWQEFLKLR